MRGAGPELARKMLTDFSGLFEQTLVDFLPETHGMESQVNDAMRYALMAGGKRLRPFLISLSASLFSVEQKSVSRVAAAVECVHTYSLIHDDLPAMDDDDMRRGMPSVHKKFDQATAILAGDALLTLAFEILAGDETHPDAEVRCELIRKLSVAIGVMGMVGGQMIDLRAENQNLNQNEIERMQQMKTGALIFFSCETGAILAKVNGKKRDALGAYARNIGLAFQIVDDLLDVEGRSEDIGKTAGKDIQAGKATLVSLMGIEEARQTAERLVGEAIDNLRVFDERADALRSLAAFVFHRVH